jgi:ATP-dependent Clp protease ATP-binding subunit ClpA
LFTQPARDVLAHGATQARALAHGSIGPEHLLLALLASASAPPIRLGHDHATVTTLRAKLMAELCPGDDSGSGFLPYNLDGKQVIDEALTQARQHGRTADANDLLAALISHATTTTDSPLRRAGVTDLA